MIESFKQWLHQSESTARKRAAMNPGVPAQAGLVFSKQPYSVTAFCQKLKSPGIRVDNMNTDNICGKDNKVASSKGALNYPNV